MLRSPYSTLYCASARSRDTRPGGQGQGVLGEQYHSCSRCMHPSLWQVPGDASSLTEQLSHAWRARDIFFPPSLSEL